MYLRILAIACALLMLVPMAEARSRSNKIPKRAKYTHVTGAKHFKYKSPKKQKRGRHGR